MKRIPFSKLEIGSMFFPDYGHKFSPLARKGHWKVSETEWSYGEDRNNPRMFYNMEYLETTVLVLPPDPLDLDKQFLERVSKLSFLP